MTCSCVSTKSSLVHLSSALNSALDYANSLTNLSEKPSEKSLQWAEIPK
jgi:hypothetical protein